MKRKISFPAAAEQAKRPPMKKTADEKMVSFADGVCDTGIRGKNFFFSFVSHNNDFLKIGGLLSFISVITTLFQLSRYCEIETWIHKTGPPHEGASLFFRELSWVCRVCRAFVRSVSNSLVSDSIKQTILSERCPSSELCQYTRSGFLMSCFRR